MKMKGWLMEDEENSLILTLTGVADFLTLKRGRFLYPNHGREGGYLSPNEYLMKVEISSFSETLILNPS